MTWPLFQGWRDEAPCPGTKLRCSSPMAGPSQKATAFIFSLAAVEQGWTDAPTTTRGGPSLPINCLLGGLFCPSALLFRSSRWWRQEQKGWRASDCFANTQPSSKRFKARYSSARRSWGRSVPTVSFLSFLQTQKDAFLLWKAYRPRNCKIALQTNKRPRRQCLDVCPLWVSGWVTQSVGGMG